MDKRKVFENLMIQLQGYNDTVYDDMILFDFYIGDNIATAKLNRKTGVVTVDLNQMEEV